MIKLSKNEAVSVVSDEELEFLANTYHKLKSNKIFNKCSHNFQSLVNDYLGGQLKEYRTKIKNQKLKEEKHGR